MTLQPKKAVMSAALGLALTVSPPAKADNTPPDPAEIKKIGDDVRTLRQDIKEVQEFQKDARAALFGTKDTVGGLNNGVIGKLNLLDDRVRKLEEKLDRMNDQLSVVIRSASASPLSGGNNPVKDPGPLPGGVPQTMTPPPGGTPPAAATRGTVRVVNEYAVEVSMLLNGKAYRVPAGESRPIEVPPGQYTYELLQSGAQPVTSTIKDGETVTLRIH